MNPIRLFHTLRHLRPIQIISRGWLLVHRYAPVRLRRIPSAGVRSAHPILAEPLLFSNSYRAGTFCFLNRECDFSKGIDWEFNGYGRLWSYNLNYFDYLNQEFITQDEGCRLIEDYIGGLETRKTGLEPYPLSLRIINWVRFFCRFGISDERFDTSLYRQADLLARKPEYHLLANHLLENGFALLFAACYFEDSRFYARAKRILVPQLKEQILPDGGHFERSPMYHSLMLLRILDCYNLTCNNPPFGRELAPIFETCAGEMIRWLKTVCLGKGDLPLINDAADGIVPPPESLFAYASRLGIPIRQITLGASGFRKLVSGKFELLADVGAVAPCYQPGHAHAGTFGFTLYIHGRPVLTDSGTSTYEIGPVRRYERSTAAHNTVVIGGRNSSDVWASHRVGARAHVRLLSDGISTVEAEHDGYRKQGSLHNRRFKITDDGVRITDRLHVEGTAYLHFAPEERVRLEGDKIFGPDYVVHVLGANRIECFKSNYSPQFNCRLERISFRIVFSEELCVHIT